MKIKKYHFTDFRSDEGNYNSFGVDLDIATFVGQNMQSLTNTTHLLTTLMF